MKELGRLRDEGDAFERELLASARRDRMSPDARRALLATAAAAVGAGVVAAPAPASAASATAAATKASAFAIFKWAALGALASGVLAVGAVTGARALRAPVPATSAAAVVAPPEAPAVAASGVADAIDVTPPPAIDAPSANVPGRHRKTPRHAAPRDSADETSLGLELKLVERARAALAAGRSADALAALDEHRARFARGALAEEAQVLRIEALVRAGDTKTASSLARSFLASRPRSPYADRVQRALRALDGEGAK